MMDNLRSLLTPPDLMGAEATGRGRLLHAILLILLATTASIEILLLRLMPDEHLGRWLALAALGVEVAAFVLLRRGRVRVASAILTTFIWAILMLAIYLGDGINSLAEIGQVLLIFMSGLVISEPFAALLTLLTIPANYGAMLLQMEKVLPFESSLSPSAHWVFQSILLLATLALMNAFMRSLRNSFAETKNSEQALKDRVGELRQAQAQLEMSDQNLRRREAILESVRTAAEKLFRGRSFGKAVQQVLKDLGQATGVDRVHIFENHRDPMGDLLASERYEWMAGGIDPQ